MLGRSAPLSGLLKAFNTSGLDGLNDKDTLEALLENFLLHGRVDLLHWVSHSKFYRIWSCVVGRLLEHHGILSYCRVTAAKLNVNQGAVEALIKDKEAALALKKKILHCSYTDLQLLIENGCSSEEIASLIALQQDLIKQVNQLQFKPALTTIGFKESLSTGMNALELAAYHGHMHLVQWILEQEEFENPEGILLKIALHTLTKTGGPGPGVALPPA